MDRELPPGEFSAFNPSTIWQVGYVFDWSPVFDSWVDNGIRLSIRPGEGWRDAFVRSTGAAPDKNTHCFTLDM